MSLMKEILKQNIPIWDACAETPFLRELRAGTLPAEKFKEYIVQDSIYLKSYARLYGKLIYHSSALKDIQMYYSVLGFVTDTESEVRLRYLKRFGMTDEEIEYREALPENQKYIDFMMAVAERGRVREMLMAVLPCMLSYSCIFRKIAATPEGIGLQYADFIWDYAEDKYFESCICFRDFADEKCRGLAEREKEELRRIFKRASILELRFWEMAYGGGR